MRLLAIIVAALLIVVATWWLRGGTSLEPTEPRAGADPVDARTVTSPVAPVREAGPAGSPPETSVRPDDGSVRPTEPDTQAPLIEGIIRPETGYAKADVGAACLALRKLKPDALKDSERKALRWVLFERTAHETIRNDAANVLLRAKDGKLAGALMAQLRDQEQTPVWRNYCVQHLAMGYREFKPGPEVIETIFGAGDRDPHESVRDCCLLHLSGIARDDKWSVSRPHWHSRVAKLARRFLSGEESTDIERISGIHAAERLGLLDEAPRFLEWLSNKSAPLGIRKASVTALGMLAPKVDGVLRKEIEAALASAAKDRNRHLRVQAERALAGLKGGER